MSEWTCPTCHKPHNRFDVHPALLTIIIFEAAGLLILLAYILLLKP